MINKDSIVTAYDEHLTLVEWLQRVEKALDSAVLTNLGIAKLSDKDNVATYQVTATFADNTAIASDSFTLPSTDIVTAFNNLTTLVNGFDSRIATNRENVNSILDVIDIANDKINADVLKNSINGDDNVIVEIDNDEDNEKLGIHLAPELQSKIAKNTEDIAKKQDLITSETDLTAKTVTADIIKTDSYVKPASIEPSEGEINIIFNDATRIKNYLSKKYAHWRISNGKLSIVILIGLANTSDSSLSYSINDGYIMMPGANQFVIPSSVAKKLYPTFDGADGYTQYVDIKTVTGSIIGSSKKVTAEKVLATLYISKYSDNGTMVFGCLADNFTIDAGQSISWRFEFNFIL